MHAIQRPRALKVVALLSLTAMSAFAFAADASRFANGQSFYGSPGGDTAVARVVPVGAMNTLFVHYGETVSFVSAGQQFTWTFDGLDHRAVNLAEIAPHGFAAQPLTVFVGKDPMNRR